MRSLSKGSLTGIAALVVCLTLSPCSGARAGQLVSVPDRSGSLDARGVLVLPFSNISGDASDEWIGAGIAEAVSADLSRLGMSSVVLEGAHAPSAPVADQLGLTDDARGLQAGRDVGVAWMVAGGFERVGRQLRVIARTLDVESGAVRQTVTLDGTSDGLFALQDRIVAELAESLGLSLVGEGQPASNAATRPPPVPVTASGSGTQFPGSGGAAAGTLTGTEFGVLAGRPLVRPTRTETRPNIDGRIDDEVWRNAASITDFVQQAPLDGAAATEATEIRLAYDSQNIYLAVHAHYAEPGVMRANRVDRDQANQDDLITVYFDTFLDQQRAYVFDVNGYGVQGDGIVNASGSGRGGGRGRRGGTGGGSSGARPAIPAHDRSWDALFESAGQIVADGFTAELAIPFKSLRYPQLNDTAPHRWGFQVVRSIRSKDDEADVWSPMSRDESGFLTQMGVLEGMTNLSTSRNLEFLPTLTGIQFGSLDSTTGGFPEDARAEGGLDLKYGITSNLTATFTFNPDFSQIESDRAQIDVNQRFPLLFPELRPFFLEGQEIFQFTSPHQWVNTRTVVDPRFGAKLTGKVGDVTLGFLAADDEAPGNLDDRSDPAYGQTAQVFIARARYDLYAQSHVGALVTDREFMDGYSRAIGVDGQFRLSQASRFNVIAFQTMNRDTEDRETSGYIWGTFFQRNGRNLRFSSFNGSDHEDAATDLGFIRRTNSIRTFSNASYRWWPEGWLINWGPRIRYQRLYDHDLILEDETIDTGLDFTLARSITAGAGVERSMERFAGINYWKTRLTSTANVATSRRVSVGGNLSWGDQIFFNDLDPFLGRGTEVGLEVSLRPIARLQSQLNIDTSRLRDLRTGDVRVFDIKLFRALTTYQFTERLLLRNITDFNTFDHTVGVNFLATYRINAGTVFFLGYDDRYRQFDRFEPMGDELLLRRDLQRTNRAIFTKLQYLFRL
jgi:TolB-like protein